MKACYRYIYTIQYCMRCTLSASAPRTARCLDRATTVHQGLTRGAHSTSRCHTRGSRRPDAASSPRACSWAPIAARGRHAPTGQARVELKTNRAICPRASFRRFAGGDALPKAHPVTAHPATAHPVTVAPFPHFFFLPFPPFLPFLPFLPFFPPPLAALRCR
jgi:hypothetical protein